MPNTMIFPPKDGKGNGRLWTKDAPHQVRVDFSAFRFGKIDGGYHLIFEATDCSAYNKNDEFKYPGIVETHIDNSSDNPGYVLLISYLEQLDPDKCYSGFIEIDGSMKAAAKALSKPEFAEMLKDDILQVMEVECPEALQSFSPKAPAKKGGYNSKSRLQIMEERLEALNSLQHKWDDLQVGFSGMLEDDLSEDAKVKLILGLIN